MKKTLIVYSSNRATGSEFNASIRQSIVAGCCIVEQQGTPDVALARNFALTKAVKILSHRSHDVLLMVDDDMVWTESAQKRLVDHVRETKEPASAGYILRDGNLAAHYRGPRWNVGLGFLAIPADMILALAEKCDTFEFGGLKWLEFTRSGVVEKNGERSWVGEDYYFTDRLDGVNLVPIAVGHIKTRVLMPSESHMPDFIEKHSK